MLSPKQEAELIVDALFEDYGTGGFVERPCPYIDGKEAILEMKENNFPGWGEVEWGGYYIKYLVQKISKERITGGIEPYDLGKRHLVKGNYVWDTRLFASERGYDVILGDLEEYGAIVRENGGIGILVVDAVANRDLEESFKTWHERIKGGSSDYSIEREIEGRPSRIRKTAYMIVKVFAYYITPDDLKEGVTAGWLDTKFQRNMRNAGGSPRKPKYRLKAGSVPPGKRLFVKNFNADAEEFAEEYPEYA
ncbi:MAG: hypothetical protein PHT25_11955 [Bacteroidales bacterium]|jgi:hypothetical protein|nr:hypothetical protein [Bacteroidales bacterium]